MDKNIKELTSLMRELHELKHKGKLPKEIDIDDFRGFIECFNPEDFKK